MYLILQGLRIEHVSTYLITFCKLGPSKQPVPSRKLTRRPSFTTPEIPAPLPESTFGNSIINIHIAMSLHTPSASDCLPTTRNDTVIRCHYCSTLVYFSNTASSWEGKCRRTCENNACGNHHVYKCFQCPSLSIKRECWCCEAQSWVVGTGLVEYTTCKKCGYPFDSACSTFWAWGKRGSRSEVDLDDLKLRLKR